MKRLLQILLLGSVMSTSLAGCYVRDRPVVYGARARVWVPAHWQWNGYQNVWVPGHWRWA
jgi:hypothetical protein